MFEIKLIILRYESYIATFWIFTDALTIFSLQTQQTQLEKNLINFFKIRIISNDNYNFHWMTSMYTLKIISNPTNVNKKTDTGPIFIDILIKYLVPCWLKESNKLNKLKFVYKTEHVSLNICHYCILIL